MTEYKTSEKDRLSNAIKSVRSKVSPDMKDIISELDRAQKYLDKGDNEQCKWILFGSIGSKEDLDSLYEELYLAMD